MRERISSPRIESCDIRPIVQSVLKLSCDLSGSFAISPVIESINQGGIKGFHFFGQLGRVKGLVGLLNDSSLGLRTLGSPVGPSSFFTSSGSSSHSLHCFLASSSRMFRFRAAFSANRFFLAVTLFRSWPRPGWCFLPPRGPRVVCSSVSDPDIGFDHPGLSGTVSVVEEAAGDLDFTRASACGLRISPICQGRTVHRRAAETSIPTPMPAIADRG